MIPCGQSIYIGQSRLPILQYRQNGCKECAGAGRSRSRAVPQERAMAESRA